MKNFFDLREGTVRSADKKPEKYTGPDGKPKIRMVPTDIKVVDEINLKDLGDKIAKSSGTKNVSKALNKDKTKDDLKAMRAGLATEDKDPEEYDQEGDMAKTQLKTMLDAAQELHDMLGDDDNLPEWVQKKIIKATDYIDSARDYMKTESTGLEESITKMSNARLKYHATKNFPHGSYSNAEIEDEHKRRQQTEPNYHKVKPSLSEADKPDAVQIMRNKQQIKNISSGDREKLLKIRGMLDREKKK